MATATRRSSKSLSEVAAHPEGPVIGLLLAALIVGLAIATSGPFSKGVNGVGGILWISSAAALGIRLKRADSWVRNASIAFFITLTLVLLVKPTDLLWAAVGFTIGGALMGLAVSARRLEWAGFMAAIWLPTHLLVAIARVIERSVRNLPATVRTDPPPTAAIVPFAMVVFALLGSRIIEMARAKQNPAK